MTVKQWDPSASPPVPDPGISQRWWSRVWTTIKSGIAYLKNKVVTFVTWLRNNAEFIEWLTTALVSLKRFICELISQQLSATVVVPSDQITWITRLKQFNRKWVVPIYHLSTSGLETFVAQSINEYSSALVTATTPATAFSLPAATAATATAPPSPAAVGALLSAVSPVGSSSLSSATVDTGPRTATTIALAGLLTPYVGPSAAGVIAQPIIAIAGEGYDWAKSSLYRYFTTAVRTGIVVKHVVGFVTEACLKLTVSLTDTPGDATHLVTLTCQPSTMPYPCTSVKHRAIRFLPLHTPTYWERKLFPPNGDIVLPVSDVAADLQLPVQIFDVPEAIVDRLEREWKRFESAPPHTFVWSNRSYDDYLILRQEVADSTRVESDRLVLLSSAASGSLGTMFTRQGLREESWPLNLNRAQTLLERIGAAAARHEFVWKFEQEWADQWTALRHDATSTSANWVALLRAIQRAIEAERRVTALSTPKSEFLTSLAAQVQQAVLRQPASTTLDARIHAAEEALARYDADPSLPCYDEDVALATGLEALAVVDPVAKRVMTQLTTVLNTRRSWTRWFGSSGCQTRPATSPVMSGNQFVDLRARYGNPTTRCAQADDLSRTIRPYTSWKLYQSWNDAIQRCQSPRSSAFSTRSIDTTETTGMLSGGRGHP